MRGEITLKILKTLAEIGIDTTVSMADFTVAFLEAGYGASSSRLDYFYDKRRRKREKEIIISREKEKFYKLLHKLKKDGLILKDKARNGKISITQKGAEKLKALENKLSGYLPIKKYEKQEDKELKIIIFDIPEKVRNKRKWLRDSLFMLGFTMLQKSVWLGKNKIPYEFIEDLRMMNLLPFVEIFKITKTGSLKQIND